MTNRKKATKWKIEYETKRVEKYKIKWRNNLRSGELEINVVCVCARRVLNGKKQQWTHRKASYLLGDNTYHLNKLPIIARHTYIHQKTLKWTYHKSHPRLFFFFFFSTYFFLLRWRHSFDFEFIVFFFGRKNERNKNQRRIIQQIIHWTIFY